MEKIIFNNESYPVLRKKLELEKIVLNHKQFLDLIKQLGITESFAKKALNLKSIYFPSVDGLTLNSYEKYKKLWSNSNVRTMGERFALIGMIKFAILEEHPEGLFSEILDLSRKSIDEIGQILVIRAMAQKILKEELVVI